MLFLERVRKAGRGCGAGVSPAVKTAGRNCGAGVSPAVKTAGRGCGAGVSPAVKTAGRGCGAGVSPAAKTRLKPVSQALYCCIDRCGRYFPYTLLALIFVAGCSSRETLVVYSPHGAEMLGDYEKLFEAAYPELDLQWLDMGASEAHNRVRAERSRPAGDIWWGAPSVMFSQAAKEGLLEPYVPSWSESITADLKDPADQWYATFKSPLAILYNVRGLNPDELPRTWDDLLAAQWGGRISLRKIPPSGTMRTFVSAMIARASNETLGFEWLQRLHENTESYPESPNLLFDHIKKNEEFISVWLMPDIVMQQQRNGFPFGYHVPPETPVLTDGIAIIKNAPHPEWARKFYEFVTTKEALIHQAEEYAKLPARNDISPSELPAELIGQAIDPMKIDWDEFESKGPEWIERWEREIYRGERP